MGGRLLRTGIYAIPPLQVTCTSSLRLVADEPFVLQVRSVYRVVEFAMGVDGYLFKHEWCLYVFEAAPMFIALSVLAWYHPVKWMQQSSRAEFVMQDGVVDSRTPNKGQVRSEGNAV